jgi:hypothetical protein
MIQFEHLKLARRKLCEVKRYHDFLLTLTRGDFSEVAIVCEADGRCCRLEPWAVTAAILLKAARPDWSMARVGTAEDLEARGPS